MSFDVPSTVDLPGLLARENAQNLEVNRCLSGFQQSNKLQVSNYVPPFLADQLTLEYRSAASNETLSFRPNINRSTKLSFLRSCNNVSLSPHPFGTLTNKSATLRKSPKSESIPIYAHTYHEMRLEMFRRTHPKRSY